MSLGGGTLAAVTEPPLTSFLSPSLSPSERRGEAEAGGAAEAGRGAAAAGAGEERPGGQGCGAKRQEG